MSFQSPKIASMPDQQYRECAEACTTCTTACNQCITACMHELDLDRFSQCMRLALECTVLCRAAADLLNMNSSHATEICRACVDACNACADECDKHTAMEYCKLCAAACRNCAKECSWMLSGKVTVAEDILSD